MVDDEIKNQMDKGAFYPIGEDFTTLNEVYDTLKLSPDEYYVDTQGLDIDKGLGLRLRGAAILPWPQELSEVEIRAMELEVALVEIIIYMQKVRESLRMSYGLDKLMARRLSKEINSYIKNYE